MAISDSKIKNNVNTLVKTGYITPAESAKRTADAKAKSNVRAPASVSSKAAVAGGKPNLFDNKPSMTPGYKMEAISAYPPDGNPGCNGSDMNVGKSPDDRNLTQPAIASNCGTNPTSNLAAASLLEHMTTGLAESKVLAIETMLTKEHTKYAKHIKYLDPKDKSGDVLKGMVSVRKAISQTGGTIKDKTNFATLLSCVNNSGANGGYNQLLVDILIAGLLAQALCVGVEKLREVILDLIASGLGIKGSILTGIIDSFTGSKDIKAHLKHQLISEANGYIGARSDKYVAMGKTKTIAYLNSLKRDPTISNNPNAEYTASQEALRVMDPNWGKDNTGTPNLSKTKNNEYLEKLSTKKLASDSTPGSNVSNTPTPTIVGSDKYNALLTLAANAVKRAPIDGSKIVQRGYS